MPLNEVFVLLPKCCLLASALIQHIVGPGPPCEASRLVHFQKKLLLALPPFAMSCLRANITSLMRDRSLPEADTDLVKSQVEHTRIHLLGFDFMFSSSASYAA